MIPGVPCPICTTADLEFVPGVDDPEPTAHTVECPRCLDRSRYVPSWDSKLHILCTDVAKADEWARERNIPISNYRIVTGLGDRHFHGASKCAFVVVGKPSRKVVEEAIRRGFFMANGLELWRNELR